MSFAPSSPVTGSSVTGLAAPTYTFTTDVAPTVNGKQFAVTTLGGTQTGVATHAVSNPFSVTFFRPANLRVLPPQNPVTGVVKNIPMNTYKFITRKGVSPGANLPQMVARITTIIEVPAGADTADAVSLAAMLSAHFGVGNAQASGIYATVTSGII